MNRLKNRAAALAVLLIAASALLLSGCRTTYIPQNDFDVDEKFARNEWNARLLAAVKDGDLEAARECLSHKAKPSVYDCIKQSALMYACWNSDLPMVRLLCEWRSSFLFFPLPNSAGVNRRSEYSYTALFCAAYKGNAAIMEYLVGKNAQFAREVRVSDNRNHTQTIIEIVRDRNGENILHKLAKSKSPEAVQEFIRNHRTFAGEDIWQRMSLEKDRNGYTPFHYAVIGGKVELVKLVLSLDKTKRVLNEGADDHTFPLYTAFEIRNLDIFRFMLEQPETKIHCRTPVKKTETEYQEMTLRTFSEKELPAKIITRTYSTRFFQSMYANRQEWEEGERKTDIVAAIAMSDDEIAKRQEEFYEAVYDKTKTVADLENIKRYLGSDVSGISVCAGKEFDFLQQAIRSSRPVEQKLEVLSFLLDSGIKSSNTTDGTQALAWSLDIASSTGDADDITVVKFLINNHAKYREAYSLILPNDNKNNPWMQILGNETIRNSFSKEELMHIVGILNRQDVFTNARDYVFPYIVVGAEKTSDNKLKYKEELFNYFSYFLTEMIYTPDKIPIATWMYENNFRYGVKKILSDELRTKKMNIKNASYRGGSKDIRLVDLLKAANDTELLQLYYAVYPEEDPSAQKNSSPQGRSHFRQKHDSP